MKVALVYDRVNKFGGAERVLLALHKIWPDAPLYTAVYDSKGAWWADNFKVVSSFIQNFPGAKKYHEIYPWLMPFAFESFNFSDFDLVISITSAEAKGIIAGPNTLHLCYCLTPTRYLWTNYNYYLNHPQYGLLNPLAKLTMKPILARLKKWDRIACHRPDYYIAISKTVAQRIKKYYQRDSEVIYPPVDTEKFYSKDPVLPVKAGPLLYFLVVSRLVSYKRIDIVIAAFNKLGLPLKIIGDGAEREFLKRKARANIQFLTKQLTDGELLSYYENCSAVVFSGEEDFGIAVLEAQACGKPVIGYKMGGVAETVIDGKTGVLFYPQTAEALIKAVKSFKARNFEAEACRKNAQRFSQKNFINKFKLLVEGKWQKYQKQLK